MTSSFCTKHKKKVTKVLFFNFPHFAIAFFAKICYNYSKYLNKRCLTTVKDFQIGGILL